MTAPETKLGHSSTVRMQLRVNGSTLSVREVGPDFIVLANSIDHPPTDAELIISIDGQEDRRILTLVDGLRRDRTEIVFGRDRY